MLYLVHTSKRGQSIGGVNEKRIRDGCYVSSLKTSYQLFLDCSEERALR